MSNRYCDCDCDYMEDCNYCIGWDCCEVCDDCSCECYPEDI